jgi:hypothetical protein
VACLHTCLTAPSTFRPFFTPSPQYRRSCHAAQRFRPLTPTQAQLSALTLPNVAVATTVDTGDYYNIHPPDKQTPARRLANQALRMIHGVGAPQAAPMYAGSKLVSPAGGKSTSVRVDVRAGGQRVKLTVRVPESATQSTTLGLSPSVPRNRCVTDAFAYDGGRAGAFPQDCGYPAIGGLDGAGGWVWLNATAAIGTDASSIVLTAELPSAQPTLSSAAASVRPEAPFTPVFTPLATSYGRASWPMSLFFTENDGLPVLPWYANLSTMTPWDPPAWGEDEDGGQRAAGTLGSESPAPGSRGGVFGV